MSTEGAEQGMQQGVGRDLTESKIRLNNAVERWTQVQRLSASQREIAREELHSAVIGLWWRMAPTLRGSDGWDSVEGFDALDRDAIWSGRHPETGEAVEIDGLADVEQWIQRSYVSTEESDSPVAATGQDSFERIVRLPIPAAIAVARVLSIRYNQFGWDVPADKGDEEATGDYSLVEGEEVAFE